MKANKTTLEVGDTVKVTNYFGGVQYVEIARVTKTKAISKTYNDANACYEFKRELWMKDHARPFARVKGSLTEYKLVD